MNKAEIENIIIDIELQGQICGVCCYKTEKNIQLLSELSTKPKYIYYINNDEISHQITDNLIIDKPDYLLIFSNERILLDMTNCIYKWGAKHYLLEGSGIIVSRKIKSSIVNVTKNIQFTYTKKNIDYEDFYIQKLDKYWEYLRSIKKKYFNGDMYSVIHICEDENNLNFQLAKTNYKNLIYSKNHDFRNEFHTCTTASIAIIETNDNYSILGKMSKDSAFSNQFKCIGGALSDNDITGTNIAINKMFNREILEEIGLDISDPSICLSNDTKWLLIREKLAFVGVCNIITLNLSKAELIEHFNKFHKEDLEKEIGELLFIKSFDELQQINEKQKADYVDELYSCYYGKKESLSWEQYKEEYYE